MAKKKKSRSTGAQRIADMFSENLTDDQRAANAATVEQTAPPSGEDGRGPTSSEETTSAENAVDLTKLPRERINTTVSPLTAQAFATIQAHAKSQGWKKPKIGEIIDEGVAMILEKYGL